MTEANTECQVAVYDYLDGFDNYVPHPSNCVLSLDRLVSKVKHIVARGLKAVERLYGTEFTRKWFRHQQPSYFDGVSGDLITYLARKQATQHSTSLILYLFCMGDAGIRALGL